MRYRVTLTPTADGNLIAELPDFPGVFSQGANREEALAMVLDAALTMCAQHILDKDSIPAASKTARKDDSIELPPLAVAKVAIHNAMVEQGVSQLALAERLHTDAKSVRRLLDLDHKSKWDHLERALASLGYVIHAHAERSASLPGFHGAS